MKSTPMLDAALDCVARGWHVFPCTPGTKLPRPGSRGVLDAVCDETQVRRWWTANPDYNVGIACGPSNLCVVDVDHGLDGEGGGTGDGTIADLMASLHLPVTYGVRTGRRPDYGLQMYFKGAVPTTKLDVRGQTSTYQGDIKSIGGYVMAAGSLHPSGEAYQVVHAGEIAVTPDSVRALKAAQPKIDMSAMFDGDRNTELVRRAGVLRNAGMAEDLLRSTLHAMNEEGFTKGPLPHEEVDRIADRAITWKMPEADVAVIIGRSEPPDPTAWRQCFHTRTETENSPDPQFLIQDFLQEESITGLIGPARARKSIITINMIHALLTGEPLFGKLPVPNRPERCVYLCPESGLLSLGRRIRNMGLAKYVGESLFYTSMNSEMLELDDPRVREASRGAVLFIDTLVRFFGGAEENSAGDMAKFFSKCQALLRTGVRAIVILHHTAKATEGIRLESGRGSGDFGGSLTAAWGTTLDNYEDAYNSLSLLVPVKERDFRAESFKLSPSGDDQNFFLQFVDGSENARVQVGAKKKAGNAKAVAFARANLGMKAPQLRDALAAQGVAYSERTCRDLLREARAAAGISGVTVSETAAPLK